MKLKITKTNGKELSFPIDENTEITFNESSLRSYVYEFVCLDKRTQNKYKGLPECIWMDEIKKMEYVN